MKQPLPSPSPTCRQLAETTLVRLVRAVVPQLPWPVLYRVGEAAGLALYLALRDRRRTAVRNLALALGDRYSPAQREVLARRSCQHLVKTLLEFVRLPELSTDELLARVRLIGGEQIREALSRGKGAILITPHLGNWEYMAARLAAEGLPLTVIGREPTNPAVAETVDMLRRSGGVEVLSKLESLHAVREALRANRLVGILPDQHAGGSGAMMELFGHRTPMHRIPALLARRTGAGLLPGCTTRDEHNRLTTRIDPPILARKTKDHRADVAACMRETVAAMERQIRRHPDQWLWIHKRFRDTDRLLDGPLK